jgi:hypothetical protein
VGSLPASSGGFGERCPGTVCAWPSLKWPLSPAGLHLGLGRADVALAARYLKPAWSLAWSKLGAALHCAAAVLRAEVIGVAFR